MSTQKDYVILVYNNIQKKVNISPDDFNFNQLKNEFLKEFNEDKNKIYTFSYFDNDDEENLLESTDEISDFTNAIYLIIRKDNPLIYIREEEENNDNNDEEKKNDENNEEEKKNDKNNEEEKKRRR